MKNSSRRPRHCCRSGLANLRAQKCKVLKCSNYKNRQAEKKKPERSKSGIIKLTSLCHAVRRQRGSQSPWTPKSLELALTETDQDDQPPKAIDLCCARPAMHSTLYSSWRASQPRRTRTTPNKPGVHAQLHPSEVLTLSLSQSSKIPAAGSGTRSRQSLEAKTCCF